MPPGAVRPLPSLATSLVDVTIVSLCLVDGSFGETQYLLVHIEVTIGRWSATQSTNNAVLIFLFNGSIFVHILSMTVADVDVILVGFVTIG